MKFRRVVVSGVSAAVVALLLSACGTSPSLPPNVVVNSPYYGSSTVWVDGLTQIGYQQARVRVCSVGGGPVAVDVRIPDADTTTDLSVGVVSTDRESLGDVPEVRLISAGVSKPNVTVDTHFDSNRPLRPGECADVSIGTWRNTLQTGPGFSYAVTF